MKRLILLELTFLFLATTFSSSPPPGWYQQPLPVNDFVRDIYFLDSLNGWVATVSYILRTTNGGDNWEVTDSSNNSFYKIQFFDKDTGYRCGVLVGGGASVWNTTNGGYNWDLRYNFGFGFGIEDLQFLNEDTGWISSPSISYGGIFKTVDGGNSWIRQLTGSPTIQIKAINFLNPDTGWAISSNLNTDLFRTTNGGTNWNIQSTLGGQSNDVLFLNKNFGIVSGGVNRRTTDGGFNWISSTTNVGGIKLSLISDSINWAGADFSKISKTTDSGISWFYQTSPNFDNSSISMIDPLKGWAAGTGIVKTTNGGITASIENNTSEVPNVFILNQNYPNPFNPNTVISYKLRVSNYITLKVYDIKGIEIITLVNQRQNAGEYIVEFDGSNFTSGVYFYRLEILNDLRNKSNGKNTESRSMLLIK